MSKIDPLLGRLRTVDVQKVIEREVERRIRSGGGSDSSSSSTSTFAGIPQYEDSDPASPSAEDAWVKHTNAVGGGSPIGLLLSLTTAGAGAEKYEFSYYTTNGSTIRVELT